MKSFRITIASLPDRDFLVSEIYYNEVQFAEISQENNELIVQIYSHPIFAEWEFPLDQAIEALKIAKRKLLEKSYQ